MFLSQDKMTLKEKEIFIVDFNGHLMGALTIRPNKSNSFLIRLMLLRVMI